jgi:hypothetical protein
MLINKQDNYIKLSNLFTRPVVLELSTDNVRSCIAEREIFHYVVDYISTRIPYRDYDYLYGFQYDEADSDERYEVNIECAGNLKNLVWVAKE